MDETAHGTGGRHGGRPDADPAGRSAAAPRSDPSTVAPGPPTGPPTASGPGEGCPAAAPAGGVARGLAQPVLAGLSAAVIGYAGSVAIVVQGLSAAGALPAVVASALLALAVAKALPAIGFSVAWRLPVSIAWTTPGAALLAGVAMPAGGFEEVVGAVLTTGGLIVLAGLWRPLARLIRAIPAPIANALLAGILLQLCLAPVEGLATAPALVAPTVLVWLAALCLAPRFAVPAAVAAALATIAVAAPPVLDGGSLDGAVLPRPVWIMPAWSWEAAVGIALPLFVVTMASQNLPGFAVLAANGYHPPPGPVLAGTGLVSMLAAPFGALPVNLAAITAALCAGPEAGPDPRRRWIAAVASGVGYLLLGGLAGLAATVAAGDAMVLIAAVAGLALIASLGGALAGAVDDPALRLPALATLLVTAAGVPVGGIGAPFWGLSAGLILWRLLPPPRP